MSGQVVVRQVRVQLDDGGEGTIQLRDDERILQFVRHERFGCLFAVIVRDVVGFVAGDGPSS